MTDSPRKTGSAATRRDDSTPGELPTLVNTARYGLSVKWRKSIADRMVAARSRRAKKALQKNVELWRLMTAAAAGTTVTGASYSDCLTVYEQIKAFKPKEILDCGTGITTVVLAQAPLEKARESGGEPGRVTSMEDDRAWYDVARSRLPAEIAPLVDLVHSPKVDGFYQCFRGVMYESPPDRPYDFVFSDGPDRLSPVNGYKLFNLDLINVVRRAERPVRAVVDNHYLTFYILQKVFGVELARYSVSPG